jgi:glycosyltransferase involved in cell wall biosynthesis
MTPIMKHVSISLVMTVYNRHRYLPLALESVIAQTYPNWHLTIWDDGSTDASPEIAREYASRDSRISFIPAPHTGRRPALRDAVRTTNHRYLAFIDSDDLLAPDALAATVAILDGQPHVGMVYTNHWIIDEWGKVLGIGARCQIPYSPDRLLIDFMTFHFRLLRREIYDMVGEIDAELPQSEDYDLCLKISEVTEIYHLQQPLYYYRSHPSALSSSQKAAQIERAATAVRNALIRRGLSDRYRLDVNESGRFSIQKRIEEDKSISITPNTQRGVIYCATNHYLYLEAALISALNLRKIEPNLPITIVSDFPELKSIIPSHYQINSKFVKSAQNSPFISPLIKLNLWMYSDYDETLFLDAHTLPIKPLTQIWNYLWQRDLSLVVNFQQTISDCNDISQVEREYTAILCTNTTPLLNYGAVLWRKGTENQRLFETWKQEWLRFEQQDQLALVRAVKKTQTRIVELPKSYNFPLVDLRSAPEQINRIHLLHCCGSLVLNGKFQQIANQLDPEITQVVSSMLKDFNSFSS